MFKPILFSTPMVQAILDGRKKQTRRYVDKDSMTTNDPSSYVMCITNDRNNRIAHFKQRHPEGYTGNDTCFAGYKSRYNIGDILWVRETYKVGAWKEQEYKVAFDYKASPELTNTPWIEYNDTDGFEALLEKLLKELDKKGIEPIVDEIAEHFSYYWEPGQSPFSWKPSLFMPKSAARIFLKVTNVRVERLNDISEGDAIMEGVELMDTNMYKDYEKKDSHGFIHARISFATLWDSINGKDSWQANPFVFVYEFERIEKPENWQK